MDKIVINNQSYYLVSSSPLIDDYEGLGIAEHLMIGEFYETDDTYIFRNDDGIYETYKDDVENYWSI